MSKRLVMMKPFKEVKSYSLALADESNKSLAPVIYFHKSTLLSEEEYVKLMSKLQIGAPEDCIPVLTGEIASDGTVEVIEKETKFRLHMEYCIQMGSLRLPLVP